MENAALEKYNIFDILCYVRRSRQDIEREKRTGEDTLAEQIRLMRKMLDDYETPYDLKSEIGSGDKISTRPVFQEVMELLQNKKYQAVAVKELSRLGRGSYEDMGKIYHLIIDNRIFIITPWKIYDPQNTADLRQIRFELFMSREEFETTKERLLNARYSYASQGKWMSGGVPFGYKLNSKTQKLEIIEEQAKIVRLIFNLYLNGIDGKDIGAVSITKYLHQLGIKSPTGNEYWHHKVIKGILVRIAYIGKSYFRTKKVEDNKTTTRPEKEWIVVDNAHALIINEIDFYLVQKKIKEKSVPRTRFEYKSCELAGLLVCNTCHRKMIRRNSRRKNKNKPDYIKYYIMCDTPRCSNLDYNIALESVLGILIKLKEFSDEKLIKYLEKNSKEKDNAIDNNAIKKAREDNIKILKSKLKLIFDKLENHIYTDEEFLERKSIIEKKILELEKPIISNIQNKKERIDVEKFKNKIDNYLVAYNKLESNSDKNILLKKIFKYIIIETTERIPGKVKAEKFNLIPKFRIQLIK